MAGQTVFESAQGPRIPPEGGSGDGPLRGVRQGLFHLGRNTVQAAGSTFQAMSDWGDTVERTHFDGNFLDAIRSAPFVAGERAGRLALREVGRGVQDLGGELTVAACRLVEEAAGRLVDETDLIAPPASTPGAPSRDPLAPAPGTSDTVPACANGVAGASTMHSGSTPAGVGYPHWPATTQIQAQTLVTRVPDGSSCAEPPRWEVTRLPSDPGNIAGTSSGGACVQAVVAGASSSPCSWEEVQHLRAELERERGLRCGRASALSMLGECVRGLREELVQERQAVERAEDERIAANASYDAEERELEELQDARRVLQSQRTAQEGELRRLTLANLAAERAAKEASRDAAWARDGPETDALKNAKVELAEALGAMDELRLQAKKDIAHLQKQLEAAQKEQAELRAKAELEKYDAPKSFRESIVQLFRVARNGE